MDAGARAPRISLSASNNALATAAANPPPIERQPPVVHNLTEALENLACSAERLEALQRSNNADFGDFLEELDEGPLKCRLYDCWMIFITVGEQIKGAHELIGAITEKAYADRRAA